MSIKTSMRVWEHSQTRGAMRCLMLTIADLANDDGIAWPGTAKLAEKINEAQDYTDVLIKKCIELGELLKISGRGRGHKTRFAVLCGLDNDALKRLKGVLQNPYSNTPLHETEKRGTTKGVLQLEKRGTFSDAKQRENGASPRDKTPMVKNDTHHDPNHDGVGDRARARIANRKQVAPHVAYLAQKGMGAAAEFADLDPESAIADFDARCAAGIPIGTIVEQWRLNRPHPGAIYEPSSGRTTPPPSASHQPERPTRSGGKHAPTGGSDIHDPGWREREIARIEAMYGGQAYVADDL